eukprot:GHVL01033531.1.p3 GENE.GHVL01033531.1~~GHVL01033531.1.p3  ORF type:complete len:106 (-),score=10.64 GHVL01033531.1:1386-1703(-)
MATRTQKKNTGQSVWHYNSESVMFSDWPRSRALQCFTRLARVGHYTCENQCLDPVKYPVVQWEQQFGKSNPIKSCTFSQTKVTLLIDKKAPKKVRKKHNDCHVTY